jgi:hypothetical protein
MNAAAALIRRFAKAFDVHLDRFADEIYRLVSGFTDRDATGEVSTYAPNEVLPCSMTTRYSIELTEFSSSSDLPAKAFAEALTIVVHAGGVSEISRWQAPQARSHRSTSPPDFHPNGVPERPRRRRGGTGVDLHLTSCYKLWGL